MADSTHSSGYPALSDSPSDRLARGMREAPAEIDDVSRARMERSLVQAWRTRAAAGVSLPAPRRAPRRYLFVASLTVSAAAGALLGLYGVDLQRTTRAPLAQFELRIGDTAVQSGNVSEGQTLEAGRHGHIEVNLGGSRLDLAQDSRLLFERLSNEEIRLTLEQGAVDVEFHPVRKGEQTMAVGTRAAQVFVVGTEFSVAMDPRGGTDVSVSEGVVRVVPRGDLPARELRAGQRWAVPAAVGGDYEETVRRAIEENLSRIEPPAEPDSHAPADLGSEPSVAPGSALAAQAVSAEPSETRAPVVATRPSPTRRLETARRLLRQGRHAEARVSLREIADSSVAIRFRVEAMTLIAESYTAQGYIPRATDSYRKAAHIAPGHPSGHNALFALARLLERYTQDQQAAVSAYRRYLRQAPHGALVSQASEALCRLGEPTHCGQ